MKIEFTCTQCQKKFKDFSSKRPYRLTFCDKKCLKNFRNTHPATNALKEKSRVKDITGYIRVKIGKNKWRHEHRLIMEQYIGRPLTKGEEIHHLNGKKDDNRLENLYLIDKIGHSRKHFKLFIEVQKLEWENKWLREELKKYQHE